MPVGRDLLGLLLQRIEACECRGRGVGARPQVREFGFERAAFCGEPAQLGQERRRGVGIIERGDSIGDDRLALLDLG